MKTKKILVRSVLVLVALAALCACAWCVWYIIQYYQGQSFGDRMRTNAPDDAGSFQLGRVKIPVDFDELQAMNPDIYAWVTIPDTDISYAVPSVTAMMIRSITPSTAKTARTTAAAASSARATTGRTFPTP